MEVRKEEEDGVKVRRSGSSGGMDVVTGRGERWKGRSPSEILDGSNQHEQWYPLVGADADQVAN